MTFSEADLQLSGYGANLVQRSCMKKLFVPLVACSLISCSDGNAGKTVDSRETTKQETIKPLVVNSEEGAADIRLSVQSIIQQDSAIEYRAVATYDGKEVGLLIHLPKDNSGNTFGSGLQLKSIGAPSDRLLQVLAGLYKQPIDPTSRFIDSTSLPYANLHAMMGKGKPKGTYYVGGDYKLFFEDDKEIAEIFLNVDPDGKWIELSEKDSEYRAALIYFLRKR